MAAAGEAGGESEAGPLTSCILIEVSVPTNSRKLNDTVGLSSIG